MTLLFSLLLLATPETAFDQWRPVLTIDDDFGDDEVFLGQPAATTVFKNKLYIADYSNYVFIFEDGNLLKRVGGKGKGPKEISQSPSRFKVEDGRLVLECFNNLERVVFSEDGEIAEKFKGSKTLQDSFGARSYKILSHNDFAKHPARLMDQKSGQLFGVLPTSEVDDLDRHQLARTIFTFAPNGDIILASPNGRIQSFDPETGAKKAAYQLPTAVLTRDPEYDRVSSKLWLVKNKNPLKMYRFGAPMRDIQVDDENRIWVLVTNEHKIVKRRRTEHHLFCISPQKKRVIFNSRVPDGVTQVQLSEGFLITQAPAHSTVTVYALKDMP